jgi:hypothetical protein
MNKNLLLIAAVAIGAVMVLNKAAAQVAPAGSRSAQLPSNNVNNQLYTEIMGGAWASLRDAVNSDGSRAFLMKNQMGQTVTSTGIPISEVWEEPLPVTYGNYIPIEVGAPGGGTDYLGQMDWGG